MFFRQWLENQWNWTGSPYQHQTTVQDTSPDSPPVPFTALTPKSPQAQTMVDQLEKAGQIIRTIYSNVRSGVAPMAAISSMTNLLNTLNRMPKSSELDQARQAIQQAIELLKTGQKRSPEFRQAMLHAFDSLGRSHIQSV